MNKEEKIELMISNDKCYIPLESLNNVVLNSLFEIVKQQQEKINSLIQELARKNKTEIIRKR